MSSSKASATTSSTSLVVPAGIEFSSTLHTNPLLIYRSSHRTIAQFNELCESIKLSPVQVLTNLVNGKNVIHTTTATYQILFKGVNYVIGQYAPANSPVSIRGFKEPIEAVIKMVEAEAKAQGINLKRDMMGLDRGIPHAKVYSYTKGSLESMVGFSMSEQQCKEMIDNLKEFRTFEITKAYYPVRVVMGVSDMDATSVSIGLCKLSSS
jgi:hypothetical protein